ncbi:MAG: hypothetical protein A2408_00400 [Candidatus Yonathbacteria bacterium RIFOXYC1_FULL_52_10]|uniref:Uncharacterized protein n=1 Tax=Candidatus Yonathbacteria bacterium RIFOXYD1_FULL_52_36 TaxID=1802730 RepID=A0A1G2SPG2_9BACT|nr:MAG: hypothetical protein A2408_00400 [Candidatus Yonathbacteria bacterium RIFOXYC1_FULL_52_10]OHA86271.1 MAG: hypothetical protein A2591_01770 [Candidatus Yonathbacteria bacterium RIFOXYD1_FULL_52_36]
MDSLIYHGGHIIHAFNYYFSNFVPGAEPKNIKRPCGRFFVFGLRGIQATLLTNIKSMCENIFGHTVQLHTNMRRCTMSQDSHNKGQTDAANGDYNPPHSHTEEFFAFGDHLKDVHQDNQDYRDGHQNHNEQTGKK